MESKFGFIPGSGENVANRIRRKFRMIKGGNPQLTLVHYGRGQAVRKSPSLYKIYSNLSTLSTCSSTPFTRNCSREPCFQPTNPLISPPNPQPSLCLRLRRESRTKGFATDARRSSGRECPRRCTWRDPPRYARQHPRWNARRHARWYGRRDAWRTRWTRPPTTSAKPWCRAWPNARSSESTASTTSRSSPTSATWTTRRTSANWNGVSRSSDDTVYVGSAEPTDGSPRKAECSRKRTESEGEHERCMSCPRY